MFGNKDLIFHIAKETLEKQKVERQLLADLGILINHIKPAIYTDQKTGAQSKAWAIGSQVFHSRRSTETFHEFIVDRLKITLGRGWWQKEVSTNTRHFIGKCFLAYHAWTQNNHNETNRVDEHTWASVPNGWVRSLISLALRVYRNPAQWWDIDSYRGKK